MRRYKLVLGGTAAGVIGVLVFPTHHNTHVTIPPTNASATTPAGSTSTTTSPGHTSSGGSTGSTSATTGGGSATKTATSSVQSFPYGDLAVKVTVNGSKVTAVSITTLNENDGRSASIDNYAIPQLEQQVIAAGSVHIDGVSGATFTSQAFVNAVADALGKLGIAT